MSDYSTEKMKELLETVMNRDCNICKVKIECPLYVPISVEYCEGVRQTLFYLLKKEVKPIVNDLGKFIEELYNIIDLGAPAEIVMYDYLVESLFYRGIDNK